VKQFTQFFTWQGAAPTGAQSQAYGYIDLLVNGQASILAYIDIFYTWAIFAALLVPVVLLMIRRVSGGGHASAMH
jgi:MFS transporter, DHA2 family, multidrug resistance protein